MLKIKDNVDLKKLKKFGFEYISGDPFKSFDNETIHIQERNKYIYITNECSSSFNQNIIEEESLDTLYDLIQSDLVEKVSD